MAEKIVTSGYVPAIDGLRAAAVSSVILFHLNSKYIPGGFNGVDMFYAISGFVVTLSLQDRKFSGFGDFLSFFYARRLLRIMPALVLTLLATFVLSALFIPEAWTSVNTRSTGLAAFAGASNIVLALNSDNYFSPSASLNPYTHTWSLGVEEQFYLIFPLIMYFRQIYGKFAKNDNTVTFIVIGLSLISLVICGVLTRVDERFAFYLIPARFWELGLGMCLSLSMRSWQSLPGTWRAAIEVISITAIAFSFTLGEARGFPFPLAALPVLGTVGLIASVVVAPRGWAARALTLPPVIQIGRLSYSLYLWHWPVMVLMRWTVGLESGLYQALAIALTIVLATLSYAFVETRFRSAFKGLRRITVILGAIGVLAVAASGAYAASKLAKHYTLSVTRDHADWYAEAAPVRAGSGGRCDVKIRKSQFDGANVTDWTPQGCGAITRRVFVLGDSHAVAIAPALARLASDRNIEIIDYSKTYCGFLTLDRPMSATSPCHDYAGAVIARVNSALHPGDVIWLEGLRLPRFIDQDGTTAAPAPAAQAQAQRDAATVEAIGMLRAFAGRGARIVLPLPLPVLPSPPFRCSDWFNHSNPICRGGLTIERTRIEEIRRPVIAQIDTIAAAVPAVAVWDPLPFVCPGASCTATLNGRPAFFDGDHLSGYGNRLLYPPMSQAIARAVGDPVGSPPAP